MKIVFATGNKGKLQEAQEILGSAWELVTPAQLGITEEIPETGETLKENSIQKAEYLFQKTGLTCFADDTGLEVDALDGAPGVYTARYAGEGKDFDDNMDKLLEELEKVGAMAPEARTAHFRCVVTMILPDGSKHCFDGDMPGRIAPSKAGARGFGYDPVFIPDVYPDKTLAELSLKQKDAISHRGQAMRAMAEWFNSEK